MKYAKMLGLAALAALAVTAFVGAGSASAAQLCKNSTGTECYALPQSISGSTSAAVLTGSLPVNCASATAGKAESETGGVITGKIEELTFTNCHEQLFGTSCTVTSTVTPGSSSTYYMVDAEATGGGNGNMWVGPSSNGTVPGAHISCPSIGAQCFFTANGTHTGSAGWAVLAVTGGNPATAKANNVTLTSHENTGICGSTGTWNATYTLSPKPLFIV
jgi:hypothetical protein